MHYGGPRFYATNITTKERIEENSELSPLDIEKLNNYYPPIRKFLTNYAILSKTFEASLEVLLL